MKAEQWLHLLKIVWLLFWFISGPILAIFAMNTLFPVLAIPYDFWSWLSVLVLRAMLQYKISFNRK